MKTIQIENDMKKISFLHLPLPLIFMKKKKLKTDITKYSQAS